jgi:hypothetical protein
VFEPVSTTNGHVQGYSLNFKLVEILSEKSPNRQQNLQNHILFLQTVTVKCTENAFAEVRFNAFRKKFKTLFSVFTKNTFSSYFSSSDYHN